MSQSPTTAEDAKEDYVLGWMAMSESIAAGGSFSGHEMNCCFLNTGSARIVGNPESEVPSLLDGPSSRKSPSFGEAPSRFADMSGVAGLDFPDDGRTVCVMDWDHDGALDLWLGNRTGPRVRLMHNQSPSGNHFVAVRLTGQHCNRDAIGARLELYLKNEPMPLLRTLRGGDGFLSQSSKWIHFGLGSQGQVDRLIVHWPGGEKETFAGFQVDRHYQITEGEQRLRHWQRPSNNRLVTDELDSVSTAGFDPHGEFSGSGYRVVLAGRVTVPQLSYETESGGQSVTVPMAEGCTLVNLWSTTCAPCLAELKDFVDAKQRIEASSLRILPLNVDDKDSREDARKAVARLGWNNKWGFARDETVFVLDILQRITVSKRRQMPIPTSFLIDPNGRLVAIYKGALDVDQLLEDVAGAVQPVHPSSVPFAGTWLNEPVAVTATTISVVFEFLNAEYTDAARDVLARIDIRSPQLMSANLRQSLETAHINLGAQFVKRGESDGAMSAFERALKINPNSAKAHYAAGRVLKSAKEPAAAAKHFQQAVAAQPDYAEAHFEMGMIYVGLAKAEPALRHLRAADSLRPDWIAPKNVMARVLSVHPDPKIRDRARAIQLAKQTVRITQGKDAQSWETLSVVLASTGNLDGAILAATRGVEAASEAGNQPTANRIQSHMKRLQSRKKAIKPSGT